MIKFLLQFLGLGLILFFCTSNVEGHDEQAFNRRYSVVNYTDENGLPQNSVKAITQGRDGFVWIATENGLVRFDGLHFFTFNKENTGITNSRFFEIQPDLEGNKGRVYAASDDHILRIENGIALDDSRDSKKRYSKIPHYIENYSKRFLSTGLPNHNLETFSSDFAHYIILIPGQKGAFYLLSHSQLELYQNWKRVWARTIHNRVYERFFTHAGAISYLTNEGDVLKYGPNGNTLMPIRGDILRDDPKNKNRSDYKIYWNNVSDQVFILNGSKLYQMEMTTGNSWSSKLILDGFDFKTNNIKTLHYEAKTAKLFLGSVTRGLFIVSKKAFHPIKISENDDENVSYAQTLFGKDKVLTSTGIALGMERSGNVVQLTLPAIRDQRIADKRAILTDHHGNIWVKSFTVLFKFNSDGTKVLNTWEISDEIKTLYMGNDDRIWLGLKSGGLYFIDTKLNNSDPVAFKKNFAPEISYLLQTEEGLLWVGTRNGLFSINLKNRVSFRVPGSEKLNVRSLYAPPGPDKGLFVMTYENGILFYRHDKLTKLPLDNAKNLVAAHCMIEDKKGFLWIPTNRGLFRFAKADLISYAALSGKNQKGDKVLFYNYFKKENGFITNEFNGGCQPCALTLPNGTISLPSLNGFVWFDPLSIPLELADDNFVVDQYTVKDSTKFITKDTLFLGVNPGQISFHVSVPYFGSENSRQLAYTISSSDAKAESWNPIDANNPVIHLSGLGKGDYTLTVRKTIGFGLTNYQIKKIRIIIPGYWYESNLFKILSVILIAIAIHLYIKNRLTHLRTKNDELEEKIRLRTNRLQEALIALQNSEKDLQWQVYIRTRLVASISHDVMTPLRYLHQAADRIENLAKNKAYERILVIGDEVAKSAGQLVVFLENMIAYIKTQVQGHVDFQNINLLELIQSKEQFFVTSLIEQSNKMEISVDPGITIRSNQKLLGVILHNLIDNANKFTYNGTITLSVEYHGYALHLILADSGVGMPANLVQWINEKQTDKESTQDEYHGLGLIIVSELAATINVQLFVENRSGTRFHLIFKDAIRAI